MVLTRLLKAGHIHYFPHRLVMWRSRLWPDLRSQINKFWCIQITHTGTVMTTWREEIVPWKTLGLTSLQIFLRWGQQTRSSDLTSPDQVFFFLKCAQWIVRKKSLSMSWISCGVWSWHKKKNWKKPFHSCTCDWLWVILHRLISTRTSLNNGRRTLATKRSK